MRRKSGSASEAIRQDWALSSKETVPVVSPALLVKFVIFADIQDLAPVTRNRAFSPLASAGSEGMNCLHSCSNVSTGSQLIAGRAPKGLRTASSLGQSAGPGGVHRRSTLNRADRAGGIIPLQQQEYLFVGTSAANSADLAIYRTAIENFD